ncbi:hypothetical protein N9102_00645 [bacterium]|nr:hypothetical protein [bacterium]
MYELVEMTGSTIRFQNLFHWQLAMRFKSTLPILACFVLGLVGCERVDPVVTYTVPTKLPAQLVPGQDRMLAAMLPVGDNIWFFKVTGPEGAVDSIHDDFRNFVEGITFEDGSPELADLPTGWRRGGEKPFRYATLDVETPDKQLGISVSSLPLREDSWDQQVQDNVNRWRGQLGLPKSDQKWADAQKLAVKAADPNAVWVDIVGETGETNSMAAPFANRVPPPSSSAMLPNASAASVADEQMLAAMVPKGSDVWFFKVKGAKESVTSLMGTFRAFVEGIQFEEGVPKLEDLPKTWTLGGENAFRFATLDVATPAGKLDVSISKLLRQQDKPWAEQVVMNVNRWRGQMGLPASTIKWAGGQPLSVKTADEGSVWVNLSGDDDSSTKKKSVTPPVTGQPSSGDANTGDEDDPVTYVVPKGWRDGRMSSMRLAAFNVGPEDKSAEITVIPAGGDLRGNVARWLGQVRKGTTPEQIVDQALKDAQDVTVAGVAGKRFLLIGDEGDAAERMAIDATIIPLGSDGTSNLFVKMTGPAETVEKQADAIALFLKSLKLNL